MKLYFGYPLHGWVILVVWIGIVIYGMHAKINDPSPSCFLDPRSSFGDECDE